MHKLLISVVAFALGVICLAAGPADAQQTAKVVATCGTVSGYVAGTTNYVTIDTTGAACGNNGGGGGSTTATIQTAGSAGNATVKGCDQHTTYDASDTGSKTLVAGTAGKKTYICGYILATGGTAANLSLSSGTGTDCVTTSINITPAYQLVANDRVGANSPFWNGLVTFTNADNLCIKSSAAVAHQVEVWFSIQ